MFDVVSWIRPQLTFNILEFIYKIIFSNALFQVLKHCQDLAPFRNLLDEMAVVIKYSTVDICLMFFS